MSEIRKKQNNYKFRAKLPAIFRGTAIFALIVTVLFIGIGFYWGSFRSEFRMKGLPAKLSKDVVGEVVGYERRESEDGVLKYFIKSDKATTFDDKHQELENVYLQLFHNGDEDDFHQISGDKAIYVPADDGTKNFKIFFAGDVDINTREGLKVNTEQLTYDKSTEIADAEEAVKFTRENISGSSYGAIVNIGEKTLDLLKDVKINAFADGVDDELTKSKIERASIKAGSAFLEQDSEVIKFREKVFISLTPKSGASGNISQPTDIESDKAIAFFREKEIRKIDLSGAVYVYQKPTSAASGWTKARARRAIASVDKDLEKIELYDNVEIETTENSDHPAQLSSSKAIYNKVGDTFELEGNVEIQTVQDAKPTRLFSEKAIYQQSRGKISIFGNGRITQGKDEIKGNTIKADLYPSKKIKYAIATGNAFLKQVTPERTTEITADELDATFSKGQEPVKANARGKSNVRIIPESKSEYAQFTLSSPKAINLEFRDDGSLRTMNTKGRTSIKLNAKNRSADSADKTLTADVINTELRANGNELDKVEAIGDAELVVSPLRSTATNYKTTISAPRFDCEFFAGNNAKSCSSNGKSRVVRNPTVAGKRKQTLLANRLNAVFGKQKQDVELFEAAGKAKFSEGDRNGTAENIIYSGNNGVVILRGGNPTIWDSQARGKASEIEWDTRRKTSRFKSKVSTTYYSQNQTGGSTPFGQTKNPVFLTADQAVFDHESETATYTGNARAWQGANYVRGDSLFLQQKQGVFSAKGNVKSLLYDASKTVGGRKSKTPVHVSAGSMTFQRKLNLLRYEDDVDIRQGTDRIVAGAAKVFLDKRTNDLSRTVAEKNVVITQPNRRVSGDYAEYNAVTEVVRLKGNPVRVRDSERGSSQGKEVTVYIKENKVVGTGRSRKNSTGRTRTVYKIKKGKLN